MMPIERAAGGRCGYPVTVGERDSPASSPADMLAGLGREPTYWPHVPRRLRPPARPFRLFAERRGHQGRQDRRPGARGADAGGGDHRHRQPVRRAGIQPGLRRQGHPADHRLPDRAEPCRQSAAAARPGRAAGAGRDRARQSAAPVLGGVPGHRSGPEAATHAGRDRGACRRADPVDRRRKRAPGPAAGRGPEAGGRTAAARLAEAFPDRVAMELQRHGLDDRACGGAGADRAGGRSRCPAGRHQRLLLRHARHVRGA